MYVQFYYVQLICNISNTLLYIMDKGLMSNNIRSMVTKWTSLKGYKLFRLFDNFSKNAYVFL
jgi:hypothetical protein